MASEYYMLSASLPYLPHFERADRVPITELALANRLRMLEADDYAQLKSTGELLRWRRHPAASPTELIEKKYRAFMANATNQALRDYVDWRIGGRAAMAALRFKSEGHRTPPEKTWGAGRLVRLIKTNWDKRNLGLDALFPWLDEAHQLLAKHDSISLERLQMRIEWQQLTKMGELNPIGFEFVAAYAFKWDILQRWISYKPEESTKRFQKLIEEVIGERQLVCS